MTYSQVFKKSSGGDVVGLDSLIDKSITSVTSNVSSVGDYSFYKCASLEDCTFPNATTIGERAFYESNITSINAPSCTILMMGALNTCANLASAYFENVTTINGTAVFYNDAKLKTLVMPKLTSIPQNTFYQCKKLTDVVFSELVSIGQSAFYDCESLASVDEQYFPKLTTIDKQAFSSCTGLTSINSSKITSIGIGAFYGCSNLETINLPEITSVPQNAFYGVKKVKTIDLPKVTSIGQSAFSPANIQQNSVFDTLILRSGTIATLDNINAFANTPFRSDGTGGTLYVPQALISSYQSANNWSTILGYPNNSIRAIEGSIYE